MCGCVVRSRAAPSSFVRSASAAGSIERPEKSLARASRGRDQSDGRRRPTPSVRRRDRDTTASPAWCAQASHRPPTHGRHQLGARPCPSRFLLPSSNNAPAPVAVRHGLLRPRSPAAAARPPDLSAANRDAKPPTPSIPRLPPRLAGPFNKLEKAFFRHSIDARRSPRSRRGAGRERRRERRERRKALMTPFPIFHLTRLCPCVCSSSPSIDRFEPRVF